MQQVQIKKEIYQNHKSHLSNGNGPIYLKYLVDP